MLVMAMVVVATVVVAVVGDVVIFRVCDYCCRSLDSFLKIVK